MWKVKNVDALILPPLSEVMLMACLYAALPPLGQVAEGFWDRKWGRNLGKSSSQGRNPEKKKIIEIQTL